MKGVHIDRGRRITDSQIGIKTNILSYEQNIPQGHRLILGDMSKSHYEIM